MSARDQKDEQRNKILRLAQNDILLLVILNEVKDL
jgi:hypothetical protein